MKKTLLATLGLLFVAGTASAQISANASADVTLTVVPGISITSSGTVNFGNLAPGQGTVVLDNGGGLSSSLLGISTAGSVATFTVEGHPGAQFQVQANPATLLRDGGGANLTFTPKMYADGVEITGNQTISATTGDFEIVVGGQVTVGDTQMPGAYDGEVTLTVNYTST